MDNCNANLKWESVWCEECGIFNIGECLIHGGDLIVAHDNVLPSRACLTLPKFLNLKTIKGQRGVFAKKTISQRTLFGPMEAVKMKVKPKPIPGLMEYQIIDENGIISYLDISDEMKCNWMMFVRSASTFFDQNVTAFQRNGDIYFATGKQIGVGSELRVWYSAAYANSMGKNILMPELKSEDVADYLKNSDHNDEQTARVSPTAMKRKRRNKINLENDPQGESGAQDNHRTLSRISKGKSSGNQTSMSAFECSSCGSSFDRPSQLVSHVCKEIDEVEGDNIDTEIRRRKGRPRKVSKKDTGQVSTSPQRMMAKTNMFNKNSHKKSKEAPVEQNVNNDEEVKDSKSKVKNTENIHTSVTQKEDDFGLNNMDTNDDIVKDDEILQGQPSVDNSSNCDMPFSCETCGKKFATSHMKHAHELTHTHAQSYTCQVEGCSKTFPSKFKFLRHAVLHYEPNQYKCHFCSSTFNRSDHLKNHLLIHDSNRESFTCEVCGKSYLCKSTLLFHKAKHEANEGQSLKCLVCQKEFKSKMDLKSHLDTHNRYKPESMKERAHQCPECNKTFVSNKDVRRHMITHTKERPFLCEHCPQTFIRKDHLRRHYTTHHKVEIYESQLKINPFGCSVCLKVFKKQEYLDYHMKDLHPNGIQEPEVYNAKPVKEKKINVQPMNRKIKKTPEPGRSPDVLQINLDNKHPIPLELPFTETVIFHQNKQRGMFPSQSVFPQTVQQKQPPEQPVHPQSLPTHQYQQDSAINSADTLQVQKLTQALGLKRVQAPKVTMATQKVVFPSQPLLAKASSSTSNLTSVAQTQTRALPISVQHLLQKPLKKQQKQQQLQKEQQTQHQLEAQHAERQQTQMLVQVQAQQQHSSKEPQQQIVQPQQLESLPHLLLQQQLQQQLHQQQQNQQHIIQISQNSKDVNVGTLDTTICPPDLLLSTSSSVLSLVSSFDPSKSLDLSSVIDDLNKPDSSKPANVPSNPSSTDKPNRCANNLPAVQMPTPMHSTANLASNIIQISNTDETKAESRSILNGLRNISSPMYSTANLVSNLVPISSTEDTKTECQSILNGLRNIVSQHQQQQQQQQQQQPQQQQQQHEQSSHGEQHLQGQQGNVQQGPGTYSIGWPDGISEYSTNLGDVSLPTESVVVTPNMSTNWIIQLPVNVLEQTQLPHPLGIQQQILQQAQQPNTQVLSQQPQGQGSLIQQQHQTQFLQPQQLFQQPQQQQQQQQQQAQTQLLQPQAGNTISSIPLSVTKVEI